MTFNIEIDRSLTTEMITQEGMVKFIPFGGSVQSDLFSGNVRPGAADVQVTNAAGIRHMQAKYIFEGKDGQGTPCHLFVENNGYFEPGNRPSPFHACPTMMSDSDWLNNQISGNHFRAEGHRAAQGVDIKIFDVLAE